MVFSTGARFVCGCCNPLAHKSQRCSFSADSRLLLVDWIKMGIGQGNVFSVNPKVVPKPIWEEKVYLGRCVQNPGIVSSCLQMPLYSV